MLFLLKVFHDLDPSFVVNDETLHLDKLLGKGAFGQVYAGELRRVSHLKMQKKLNLAECVLNQHLFCLSSQPSQLL